MKEVNKVMQLKGHKVLTNALFFSAPILCEADRYPFIQSAVTCLCFAPNSEQIITASKDGSIRVWNINGMIYLLTSSPYLVGFICYFSS